MHACMRVAPVASLHTLLYACLPRQQARLLSKPNFVSSSLVQSDAVSAQYGSSSRGVNSHFTSQ